MTIEYNWVGGHWALPNVDVIGPVCKAHISVAVKGFEEFSTGDMDLALWAGDTPLTQRLRPGGSNGFTYTQTRSIGCAGFFEFDNPSSLRPTVATVTLLGEQITFDLSEQDPPPLDTDPGPGAADPGDLPMV